MSAYRENAAEPLDRIEDQLAKLSGKLDTIESVVRKPMLKSEDAFWLGLWPRLGFGIALIAGTIGGLMYLGARDGNRTTIEVERIKCERAIVATPSDAGAK